jgi:hypothetical protein
MTIEAFVNILKKIDPDISRYQRIRKKSDDAYSVWSDYGTRTLYANGVPAGSVKKVQVDYFTFKEDDPVASRYFHALSLNDEIAVEHTTDFETDTRYIHHIFDCEVVTDHGVI